MNLLPRNLFQIITGITMFLLLSRCNKDIPPEINPQSRIAHPDVFNYGYFEEGSYWIYKDSLSGVEDSIYVIEASRGVDTISGSSGKSVFERFWIKLHSSYENYDYYFAFHGIHSGVAGGKDKIFMHKYNANEINRKITLFEIPAEPGTSLSYHGTTLTTTHLLDSMIIQQDTVFNVIRAEQANDPTQFDQPTVYYISKNTGIVRKEYIDSAVVWELVRFNIVQ